MVRLKILVLLVLASYIPVKAQVDSLAIKKATELASLTRSKYAPDKRTVVFNFSYDSVAGFELETSNEAAAAYFRRQYQMAQINKSLSIRQLPDTTLADSVFGLVTVSVGNMRTEPKHAAEMASQALLGWQVDVLKKTNGYYLIRTADGYISWLDAAAVSLKTKAELDDWKKSRKIIVTADYGHVYSSKDKKSLRVSDLVMGNILAVEQVFDEFYGIVFPDGRKGYIEKEQAQDYDEWKRTLSSPSAQAVLNVAKTMIGVPYLWGGTSVKGVDCSGFTKTAYFMNGFIIPRDASQQVLVGQPIEVLSNDTLDRSKALKNLEAGDLLFFAAGKNSDPNARVTHVALYMGDGEFIHSAGKVRINSILPTAANYGDFESRTIVAARRYLGRLGTNGIKKLD
ncbi:C40 family peptidase [Olivibacter sp. XZL3]|uniref:C40 family peptidase n=1 Tax=Olivibacter sp. XZL3 TaxID=1735116 RepID=UPI0010657931|nr:C40 family peptidase [Olivibacter sp. XZL3]